jgi:hypothetical protein
VLSLPEQIGAACNSVLQSKNDDGGIDSIHTGAVSGCWTTASALWSMVEASGVTYTGLAPIRDMARFLIANQIQDGDEQGGWAMLPGARPCSMSTGHSVAALSGCRHLLEIDSALLVDLDHAVQNGLRWLQRWQNEDGGWGPQPGSGVSSNSLMFSTHYALMCFWRDGPHFSAYASMKAKAVKYIVAARNKDGSWGKSAGAAGDVSDTARAVLSLVRAAGYAPVDKVVKSAISYILRNQGPKGLWPLGRIEILFPKSGGVTVFSNNRTLDALQALATQKSFTKKAEQTLTSGLEWLLESQESSTGTWYIASPYDAPNKELHTWPTTEWLHTVAVVARAYTSFAAERIPTLSKLRSALVIPAVAVTCLVVGGLVGANWDTLGKDVQQLILGSVVLAILVNLLSNVVSGSLASWWRDVRGVASARADG